MCTHAHTLLACCCNLRKLHSSSLVCVEDETDIKKIWKIDLKVDAFVCVCVKEIVRVSAIEDM